MNNLWLLLYWLLYLSFFLTRIRGLLLNRIWIKQFRLFHVMLVNKIRLGIDFMHWFSCTVLFWGRLVSPLVGLLFDLRLPNRFIALCYCFSYLFLGKYLRISFLAKFKDLDIDCIVYDRSSSIQIGWINPCKHFGFYFIALYLKTQMIMAVF